jgi:hypothetical protein
MTYVDKIIGAFGGVRPLARAINQPPTNVSGWRKRGTIPDWQKVRVLDAAQRRGIELVLTDFLPAPFKNCPAYMEEPTESGHQTQGNEV